MVVVSCWEFLVASMNNPLFTQRGEYLHNHNFFNCANCWYCFSPHYYKLFWVDLWHIISTSVPGYNTTKSWVFIQDTVCKQHYSLWGRHSFLVWLVGLVLGGVTQEVTGQDGSGVSQLQYRGDAGPPAACSVLCGQCQFAAVTCGLRVLQIYGHSACGGIWWWEREHRH